MNTCSNSTRACAHLGTETQADLAACVSRAMATSRAAQARNVRMPVRRRVKLIRELRGLIAQDAVQLAEASASARSRPISESLTAEVMPLAEAARFLEREAARILAPRSLGLHGLPFWLSGVQTEIHREPLGVVLIIGPGNYPLLLPGVQLLQALVAGNAVLLKPGIGGTAAADALCRLVVRAGFDPDLIELLPESRAAVQAAIASRPNKVLFTGSAGTGAIILKDLAPELIPATMELSGCDAVIIRPDADLDLAVKALRFGLTLNGGATCMSPKRAFVAAACATELEGRLAELAPGQRDGFTTVTRDRLRLLVEEALAEGAHVIAGGFRENDEVQIPVILGGVSPSSRLLREDIFAPILAVVTVGDDEEAVWRSNDCPFALTASVFSRDEAAARRVASRINAGVVTINDLILPTADPRAPFGGRGRSGFGVTRGAEGLLELTTSKVITVSRGKFRPAFGRPKPGDAQIFEAYLTLAHARGWILRWRALVGLIRTIIRRGKTYGAWEKQEQEQKQEGATTGTKSNQE